MPAPVVFSLLEHIGLLRYLHDLPQLTYHFSKIDDEGVQELLKEKPSNPLRHEGWKVFTAHYGLADEKSSLPALDIAPETAQGITRWAAKELMKLPYGSYVWRTQLLPLWASLEATAED